MKIKIKLTGEQCGIISQLLQDTSVELIHPKITALVQDLLLEVLDKVHGRSLWVDKKNTIGLSSAQARAFNLHFTNVDLRGLPYEQTLILKLISQIDQSLTNQNKTITKSNKFLNV